MPTSRGWTLVAAGVLLLACGLALGYREIVMLGATALLFVAGAVGLVGRVRAPQVERRIPNTRVQAGEDLAVRLRIRPAHRSGRTPHALRDRVRSTAGTQYVDVSSREAERGRGVDSLDYRLHTDRRGVRTLGPVLALRTDPLGLVRSQRDCGDSQRVWIHPPWRVLTAMPVGQQADPTGVLDGTRIGNLSFDGLREYVPGDEVRHIHWRSSARYDRLMVKEYVDTAHTRLTVLLDDRGDGGADPTSGLDEAASAAACVVGTAVRGAWSCELTLVSGDSRDSSAGVTPMLDLLAEAEPVANADMSRALWRLRNRPDGDTVVLVSAVVTPEDGQRFAQLVDRYPTLVLACVGAAAERAPSPPGVTVVSAATARELATVWNAARWSR
ncbi:DUF58 domain-containing protein [Lipingzhangella sp. LS1_29]|uniref:DUF58 domain-containing protein n=1 Tax=Lipingzhangella rawalii TaxID=2055835 RepID=A0ABU2H5U3_9ACTN|nr:DUF58 domain-containing protein [Lipingzhangella rawalii]MDS1270219.1 DUF58 domain-containing protein [Lipingzhangella rawalii]